MKAKYFKALIAKIPDDAEILVRDPDYRDIEALDGIETAKYWKATEGSGEYLETQYYTKKDAIDKLGKVEKITGVEFD